MKRLFEVERDGDRRVGMRNRLAAVRTALAGQSAGGGMHRMNR